MRFATKDRALGRVALILTGQTLQRLTGGLRQVVGPGRDFVAMDIGQEPARIIEQILAMQPAGIIMEFREELTVMVSSLGRPVVVVMADMLVEGMGCVNVDDTAIGRMAADYLWEKGLRSFGFYGFESLHAPGRRTGFLERLGERRSAMASHEIRSGQGLQTDAQHRQLDAWLGRLARPVGIFAAHDPLAREVLESCHRLGLDVPGEVAILSASNDQFTCELAWPGISSVEIPWERIGLEAARLLQRMLDGEAPGEPCIVGPTGIHARGSTDFYRVSDKRLQQAVDFMRRHLHADIGMGAVADAVGMDRRAMERLFRAQLHRSPKQVLTGMRTEQAREQLEQGDLRIGEIAEACGFGASERLALAFRKRYGKTPREWRRGG